MYVILSYVCFYILVFCINRKLRVSIRKLQEEIRECDTKFGIFKELHEREVQAIPVRIKRYQMLVAEEKQREKKKNCKSDMKN